MGNRVIYREYEPYTTHIYSRDQLLLLLNNKQIARARTGVCRFSSSVALPGATTTIGVYYYYYIFIWRINYGESKASVPTPYAYKIIYTFIITYVWACL